MRRQFIYGESNYEVLTSLADAFLVNFAAGKDRTGWAVFDSNQIYVFTDGP